MKMVLAIEKMKLEREREKEAVWMTARAWTFAVSESDNSTKTQPLNVYWTAKDVDKHWLRESDIGFQRPEKGSGLTSKSAFAFLGVGIAERHTDGRVVWRFPCLNAPVSALSLPTPHIHPIITTTDRASAPIYQEKSLYCKLLHRVYIHVKPWIILYWWTCRSTFQTPTDVKRHKGILTDLGWRLIYHSIIHDWL